MNNVTTNSITYSGFKDIFKDVALPLTDPPVIQPSLTLQLFFWLLPFLRVEVYVLNDDSFQALLLPYFLYTSTYLSILQSSTVDQICSTDQFMSLKSTAFSSHYHLLCCNLIKPKICDDELISCL